MARASQKLSVWTEGLDENWITFTGLKGRVEREPMTAAEVAEALHRINEENGEAATCAFFLQGGSRMLNLSLSRGSLTVSDPARVNYQNVALSMAELPGFLHQYFLGGGAPAQMEEVSSSHLRMLEGVIALVAVLVLAVTVFFVRRYLQAEEGFIPVPVVKQMAAGAETRQRLTTYAGLYATRIDDGEMLLEIGDDGTWGYYDIAKGAAGSFTLLTVAEGTCWPAFEDGRIAIVTDKQFLFYPAGDQNLEFMRRRFSRVGTGRGDLPFLQFP